MELFLGFYFGVMSMVVLYNFHWYNVTKEKSYLYYAVLKVSIIIIMLQTTQIIVTDNFFYILNINIIFMLIFLFSKEFLNLKKNFPSINRLINYVMIFVLLCFVYSIVTEHYSIFDLPYSLVLSPLIMIGYLVYRQGFEPAKYYVIGWGSSLSLVGIDDLRKFAGVDLYPDIPFTLISHIIESIILSYAISEKTNFLIKEKEQQSKILIHQAKLASMGHMLENISHQWRQPLNRISIFIINMQMHINDKYKKETYLIDALNQSQLQLEYMSNTIKDFTDFNKQTKEKEHFLASSVVNDVYRITGQTLEAHAISFTITNHNDFSIHSYPNELAQVVLNLVQNAQDVLIEREIKQPAINVIIDKGKISVQDNAGGIEDKIVEQIFEPYFTTKSKSSSLGLGLYMSKIILEKHFNARIEIENIKHCTSFNILFDS